MALDQNMMTLISTVVGGLLAITGGFLAARFSQRIAEKAEKRKLTRERIEELYTLSSQAKEWMRVQLLRACEVEGITLHRRAPDWFFDVVNTEPDCPIEKMEMLISLYLPSLAKTFAAYRTNILIIQHLETEMRNSRHSKRSLEDYSKATLVRTPDIDYRLESETDVVVEFIVQALDNFEQSQEQLRSALQQIAVKSW